LDVNDQLENDLCELFASRASAVPAEATIGVRGVDFHPRAGHLWSPKLTVGSLAGLATTGMVVSVIVFGGAQPAFAGWRAAPSAASPAQSTTASQNCSSQIALSPATSDTSGADWTPIATDVRGPYTVIVYRNGSGDATCFNGPSFTVVNSASFPDQSGQQSRSSSVSVNTGSGESAGSASGSSSISVGLLIGNNSDGVTRMTESHLNLDSATDSSYTLVEGQIASDVTGVTLVGSGGNDVQATTGSGWFVAWWPGNEGISSAEVTTPSGQIAETFDTTTLPAPRGGAQSCSSSVSSGAGSSGSDTHACSGDSSASGSAPVAP
jgi:hypothetical protein